MTKNTKTKGGTYETDPATDRRFQPRGLAVPARIVRPRGSGAAGARGGGHLRHAAPRGLAREERRAAHRLCRASLQRGVRPARRASAHDRSGRADLRREGLHAPVQDQRQIGLHRRRLAVAPGLRHLETTSYPLWTLDEETVTRLVKEGGIVAPTGKAGGMLMFHGNLVHGSAGNITPYPRKIVYLTLNAVSNYIRTPTRPEFIAHRDFTPIQTVDDDALLRLARSQRQAAE